MQADILRSWLLERRVYPIQHREVHQMVEGIFKVQEALVNVYVGKMQ